MRQLIRWYRQAPPRLRLVFSPRSSSGSDLPAPLPPRRGRKRILLVCFGNLCRSPVAAALLERYLDAGHWQVLSAGTDAVAGQRVAPEMRRAAAELGVDLSRHRARRLDPGLLRTSDLIITMSQCQSDKLLEIMPVVERRVRLLGGFAPQPNPWGLPADPRRSAATADEIPDPSGEDFEFHRECCRRLDDAVTRLARWIVRREASRPLPEPRAPLSAPTLGAVKLR